MTLTTSGLNSEVSLHRASNEVQDAATATPKTSTQEQVKFTQNLSTSLIAIFSPDRCSGFPSECLECPAETARPELDPG